MQICLAAKPQLISLHPCWAAVSTQSRKPSFAWALGIAFSHPFNPPPSFLCFPGRVLCLLVCLFISPLPAWLPPHRFFSTTHSFSRLCIPLPCSQICWPPGSKALFPWPFLFHSQCTPTTYWTVKCAKVLIMQNIFKTKNLKTQTLSIEWVTYTID